MSFCKRLVQAEIPSKMRVSVNGAKLEFLQLRFLPDEERLQNATFPECNSAAAALSDDHPLHPVLRICTSAVELQDRSAVQVKLKLSRYSLAGTAGWPTAMVQL
jgi:hypothetical protein